MKGSDHQILSKSLSDRYEILSTLGSGATSTVYLARHRKLKTLRAIKCIPRQMALSSSISSEANLLRTLTFPGIPILYDLEEDETSIYLIEEYVNGESLEAFVLHSSIISENFLLQTGIQLCDIFLYLHELKPDPILYVDLKPDHIIVCGDSIKLIDFGSAIFLKETGNSIPLFGTTEYAAPELVEQALPSFASDLYSIGMVLAYLYRAASQPGSFELSRIIQKATATSVITRYRTVRELKEALLELRPDTCRTHLLQSIGIISSNPGVGATHLAVSVTSVLNKNNYSCFYEEKNNHNSLSSMIQGNSHFVEQNGVLCYQYFRAVPHYGESIRLPAVPSGISIKDYGVYDPIIELDSNEALLYLFGSRDWELERAYAIGEQISCWNHVIFICNYGDAHTAKNFARHFHRNVYCFPLDADPFRITREKELLLLDLLALKGGHKPFFSCKKGLPRFLSPSESLE